MCLIEFLWRSWIICAPECERCTKPFRKWRTVIFLKEDYSRPVTVSTDFKIGNEASLRGNYLIPRSVQRIRKLGIRSTVTITQTHHSVLIPLPIFLRPWKTILSRQILGKVFKLEIKQLSKTSLPNPWH